MRITSTIKLMHSLRKAMLFVFILGLAQLVTGQTYTELVVPKYIAAKTAASTNNARTAFAICVKIDGLTPNTLHSVKIGVELVGSAQTTYGAGNVWNTSATPAAWNSSAIDNLFTTDASGSSGPVWIMIQPTGNGSRFGAGQQHVIKMSAYPSSGTAPAQPAYVGSKVFTALDVTATAMTADPADDGAYIKGSADATTTGKYVLLFDNVAGTGDPLFSYQIRQATATQSGNTALPTDINDIYMQAGTSAVGDYPAVIPASSANGVRRIEARDVTNAVTGFNTDADGVWPSANANTTNPTRGQVRYILATDAPLIPQGVPTVSTTAVSAITYNSATSGGNVTATGGQTVTARGVCWSTSANPTIADAHTTDGSGLGTFTSALTALNYNTLYHVRAYATSANGTGYGNEVTFTTNVPPFAPVVDFSASSTTIVEGQTIDFTDLSTNVPTTWNWSLMGGTPYSSTVQNPQDIQYTVAGTYDVCLTATNAYGTNTLCKTGYITVVEPVNAQIVITEIMYNSPESGTDSLEYIEFYNNGANAVNMEGYTTSGVDFTFPAMTLNPGAYSVIAVNAAAMQRTFGVSALQWTSGALSNSGEAITLKDNFGFLIDSVMYDDVAPWDTLADGWGHSLVLCDPNLDNNLGENWSAATTFVVVNAANDSIWGNPGVGCPSIVLPVAAFTSNVTEVGLNGSVAFQDQSTGGTITAWEWTFEGGTPATSTEQNPTVVYSTLGKYDVTLKVTNADGDNTIVKTDYINVVVNPGIGDVNGAKLNVTPNPSTGVFNINYNGNANSLKVYSLSGSVLLEQRNGEISNRLDLTSFNKGMYILEIVLSDGSKLNSRLIVK